MARPFLLRRQKAAYEAQRAREAADEQVVEDFEYLKSLDAAAAVPLSAATNWRAALRQAASESQRQQPLTYLPLVYEDYLMRQQLGIAHPLAAELHHRRDTRLYEDQREDLLDGRELLGEPRNFDF